jgi:hypothetical protein
VDDFLFRLFGGVGMALRFWMEYVIEASSGKELQRSSIADWEVE